MKAQILQLLIHILTYVHQLKVKKTQYETKNVLMVMLHYNHFL